MNKARAMLDALMGPGRDVMVKDKLASKEKFKDESVCKSFLVGFCPLDKEMLGSKRRFRTCGKLHSELMKTQFQEHPEAEALQEEYEKLCLQDLEYAIRECEGHIATEKQRIKDDLRRRKPALPGPVNDRLAVMKRESAALIARAEALDDNELKEKEQLITKATEMMKDRETLQQVETKKAIEAITPEEVCEVCGVAFIGPDGDAAHQSFRIHDTYTKIRAHAAKLKPIIDEREQKMREKLEGLRRRRADEEDQRKEANGRSREKDPASRDRDRDRERDRNRDRDRDGDHGRRGERHQNGSRSRSHGRRASRKQGRSRSASGRRRGRARARSDSRDAGRGGRRR